MKQLTLLATVTMAVLLTGLLIWKAEATPLAGSVAPFAAINSHSNLQKVSCMFGTSRCKAGTKWMCTHGANGHGEMKKCQCRPC